MTADDDPRPLVEQHGATCFVISGGVSTPSEAALYNGCIPNADWTIVRPRIGADERRDRTTRRGRLLGQDAQTVEQGIKTGIEEETVSTTMASPSTSSTPTAWISSRSSTSS